MYLVRTKEGREIVGLFAAPTIKELFWVIDECTNPNDCEYIKILTGGFMWCKGGTPVLAEDKGDDTEYEDDDLSGGGFSDRVSLMVDECRPNYSKRQSEWRSFPDPTPRSFYGAKS